MTEHEKGIEEAKLNSAIDAMRQALVAASEASHKLKGDIDEEVDGYDADFDRIVELGHLTDATACMCGPNLDVLERIACVLLAHERAPEHECH